MFDYQIMKPHQFLSGDVKEFIWYLISVIAAYVYYISLQIIDFYVQNTEDKCRYI